MSSVGSALISYHRVETLTGRLRGTPEPVCSWTTFHSPRALNWMLDGVSPHDLWPQGQMPLSETCRVGGDWSADAVWSAVESCPSYSSPPDRHRLERTEPVSGSKSRAHPGKGLLHLPRCPQQLGIAGNRIPMGTRASRGSDRRSERAPLNQSMPGGLRRRVLGSMGRHGQAGQLRSRTRAMLPPPIRQCLDAPSTGPSLAYASCHRLRHLYPYCLMKDQCVFTSRRNLFRCNATVSGVNDRRRVSVLFAPQTPEFCLELRNTRLGGISSLSLFLRATLGHTRPELRFQTTFLLTLDAGLGRLSTFLLFLLAQQPTSRHSVPEAQLTVRPPQVQLQDVAVRPHPAVGFLPESNCRYSPSTRYSPTSGSP